MAEGKFVVSAQNKIKEGLDGAKKDLLGFQSAAEQVGNRVKNALTVTAIAAGLIKLGKAAFDCFEEFGEADRRVRQLGIALGGNESSLKKATNLIDDMRKMSLASKDDIEGLVTELASLGKSDAEIDKITRASVNLSNITGKDLNTSFTQINATYSGTAGKLDKLIPDIGNLTKEQLAAGGATDLINGKFTGLSTTLASDNVPQKIKNLADGFSDLKENIGEMTSGFFSPLLTEIQKVIDGWNDAYTAQKNTLLLSRQGGYVAKIQAAKENKDIFSTELAGIKSKMVEFERSGLTNDRTYLDLKRQAMVYQNKIDTLEGSIGDWKKLISKSPALFDEEFKLPTYLMGNQGSGSESGGGSGAGKPLTDSELMAKFAPILTGSGSMGDYKFNRQMWEQFGDGLSVALEPVIDAVTGGLAYRGQSSLVPETLGAGGASIYDQVWAPILDALQSEFTKPAQRLAPEGYAPRDDFLEQLSGALSLSPSQESDQAAAAKYGKEYRDAFLKFTAGETLRQTIAKQLNESTQVSASLAPVGALADILKGVSAPATVPWKMGDKQTFGQSGLTPEGFTKGRSDFYEQLVTDLILPASLEAAQDGAMAFGKEYRDAMAAWDASQETAATLDAMWNDALDQMAADYKNKPGSMGQSGVAPTGYSNIPISDQIASLFPSVLSEITAGMTGAFDMVKQSMTGGDVSKMFSVDMIGPITAIMEALGPFGEMIAGMNPLLAVLIPVTEGFVSVVGPAITEVLDPLFNALAQVGQMLGAALLPIFDALMPIISLIANILTTAWAPIMGILSPIIETIAVVFDALSPVIQLLAKVFVILMAPVQFVADLFGWLGKWVSALGTNIGVAIYNLTHWLNPKSYVSGPDAFSSDAFTGLQARLDKIDALGTNSNSLTTGYAQSDATATQSASYRTQAITMNFYQYAPIVGSDGMTEFATMIRGEFEKLAYVGA